MCWDFFDKFFCISVREREDRRAKAVSQFARVGLADRVEHHLVAKHPTDPEQGIYESHMACMKKGLESGARRIVIFEDDVIFDRFDPIALRRCADYLASHEGWKICHFGCLVARRWKTSCPSVRRIRYRSLTHAYVVNRTFAEAVCRIPWEGVPFDDFLQAFDEGAYVIHPTFAFQSDAPSDNDSRARLERFRNFMGGLKRIQKMNEVYTCHRTLFVTIHAAAIGGLLLAIF